MSKQAVSRRAGAATLAVAVAVMVFVVALPAVAGASAPPAPTVTIVGPGNMSPSPAPTAAAPVVDDSYVQLYLDDDGMGADSVEFSNDGGATWGYKIAFSDYVTWWLDQGGDALWLDGHYTVTARFSADGGDTWTATATSPETLVDQQSPVVTAPQGYWNNHYKYKLSAHDQVGLSGVQDLWYRVDVGSLIQVTTTEPLGTSVPLTTSFALPGQTGTPHSIDYIAKDYAGNYAGYRPMANVKAVSRKTNISLISTSAYVVIDRSAPVVRVWGADSAWHRGFAVVRFTARDHGGAGVDEIQYSVTRVSSRRPGGWTTGTSAVVTRPGKSRVWYRAIDAAQPKGNTSEVGNVVVKVD
jgi:hypothetical protein